MKAEEQERKVRGIKNQDMTTGTHLIVSHKNQKKKVKKKSTLVHVDFQSHLLILATYLTNPNFITIYIQIVSAISTIPG